MSFLRTDGVYIIYTIQHLVTRDWIDSNLDYFGTPHPDFKSGCLCWQETGIRGTYSPSAADTALKVISETNPYVRFRLVRRRVAQETEAGPSKKGRGKDVGRGEAWFARRHKVLKKYGVVL